MIGIDPMKFKLPWLKVGALCAAGISSLLIVSPVKAATFTGSTENIDEFLIIGLTNSGIADAVNVSGGGGGDRDSFDQTSQLGADTEFLSDSGGLENLDVFGERFTENLALPSPLDPTENTGSLIAVETINVPGTDIQAAPVGVGIDFSGEIALTSNTGEFNVSNTNIFAGTGIQCASSPSACANSISDGNFVYLEDSPEPVPDSGQELDSDSPTTGVSQFDPNPLLAELAAFEAFVSSATADFTITNNNLRSSNGFDNQNLKDGSNNPFVFDVAANTVTDGDGPVVFELGNDPGFVFIDIDVGDNDFDLKNTDIIINGGSDVTAIFRLLNGSNLVANQSTILLGDGGIGRNSPDSPFVDRIGAIFIPIDEEADSGDTTLSFNDTVLNGIGLYDLTSFKDDGVATDEGTNKINIQNGQGCAQFIGSQVELENVRFNRCILGEEPYERPNEIPEPSTVAALGLVAVGMLGLKKKSKK